MDGRIREIAKTVGVAIGQTCTLKHAYPELKDIEEELFKLLEKLSKM